LTASAAASLTAATSPSISFIKPFWLTSSPVSGLASLLASPVPSVLGVGESGPVPSGVVVSPR
jgi:hypothetical protein